MRASLAWLSAEQLKCPLLRSCTPKGRLVTVVLRSDTRPPYSIGGASQGCGRETRVQPWQKGNSRVSHNVACRTHHTLQSRPT